MPARNLLAEALSGVLQRPGRSALTAFGTVLGVAVLIAVLGLTSSAAAQISTRFDPIAATEVSVAGASSDSQALPYPFLPDAEARVRALDGVTGAGVSWQVTDTPSDVAVLPPPAAPVARGVGLLAASPGFIQMAGVRMAVGAPFTQWHDDHQSPIVLIGNQVALQIGLDTPRAGQAIWIGGRRFVVGGVIADVERHPELLTAIVMPHQTALNTYRSVLMQHPAQFTLTSTVSNGASAVVAGQIAAAANPDGVADFTVNQPPDVSQLRDSVNTDLNALFFMLAGICLIIGMVGIANTTFVSVIERREEIGLRRALGARRRDIMAQFLVEALTLGALGGLIGASLGILAVVGVCLAKQWTAVLDWRLSLVGPLIGAVIGGLAGTYPAWQASGVHPSEALRRS